MTTARLRPFGLRFFGLRFFGLRRFRFGHSRPGAGTLAGALAGALMLAACTGGDSEPEPAVETSAVEAAEAGAGAEAGAAAGAEAGTDAVHPQDAFMANVAALCGRAFEGEAVLSTSSDFDDGLVMHVRVCTENEIQIPLHVGENRSRTWILTRTADGIRLKHDHRLADGSEDVGGTQYGGDTVEPGTPLQQSFPADAYTAEMIPEAATNVWSMTLEPEANRFVYHLTRHGEPRATFVVDLSAETEIPPPAWGYEGS